jgi:integral membrane protein
MTFSGAVMRYRVMSYVVGVFLITVFVCIPFQSVEKVIGPIHGVLYLVYLVTVVELVIRARIGLWRFVGMVVAGWVPGLAFVVERSVSRHLASGVARR